MGVIKEWECIEHGVFERTHPICPEFGCESASVVRVFITPPHIGTRMVRQFEAGIRKSSDMMGGANFRTARPGENAFGGQAAKDAGTELLWGDQAVKKTMGRSFAELTGIAQQPLVLKDDKGQVRRRPDGSELRLDRNNAMREAATEMGITRRRLPLAGELAVARADNVPQAKIKEITAS